MACVNNVGWCGTGGQLCLKCKNEYKAKAPAVLPTTIPRKDRIDAALREVGEAKVRAAFQRHSFIYGTQGANSATVRAATLWRTKCQTANRPDLTSRAAPGADMSKIAHGEARTRVFEAFKLFEPGTRVASLVHKEHQMMDMYYGPSLTSKQEADEYDGAPRYGLHGLRDPDIGAFVHRAMGFHGPFSMQVSGRTEYMKTFKTAVEGWAWNTPHKYPGEAGTMITPTQEMSAIIRWGIKTYGGKLIFEGKQVFYHQVFAVSPEKEGSRAAGDTELEAIDLFPFFSRCPGMSTVPWGKTAKIVFHWGGIETVPTKCHFLTNWQGALRTAEATAQLTAVPGKDIGHYPEGPGGAYRPFGKGAAWINGKAQEVIQHGPENRTKNNLSNVSFSGVPLRDFWNGFPDAPVMRNPATNKLFTADEIVTLMFGSTALGNKILKSFQARV